MTREYTNEQIKNNNGHVVARVGLSQEEINRLLKEFEGQQYLTSEDHDRLMRKARVSLLATPGFPDDYTQCGHSVASCRTALISLLRVPEQNRRIDEDADPLVQTAEEIEKSAAVRKEGAKIARELLEMKTPSYEDFRDKVTASAHPKDVEQVLLGARATDSEVQLPNGEMLPAIPILPKTLTSKKSCDVLAKVRCVREGAPSALLMICAQPSVPTPLSLEGLIGVEIETTLNSAIVSRRKELVYAQLKGRPIRCRIRVTRSLRSGDSSRTELKLSKILWDSQEEKEVENHFQQLQIDFEREVASEGSMESVNQDC